MIIRRIRLRRLPGARIATAIGFLLGGAGFASWVVRIPDVQQRLNLSEGALGLTLLGVAVGGFLALPLSGLLIARYGSRAVALVATLCLGLSLAAPPHATSAFVLALVLVVLGASLSIMAVALNTQAATIERHMRRPIMSGLHALYSAGGLAGAAAGGVVTGAGIGAGWHLGGAALVIAGSALSIAPFLLRRDRLAGSSGGGFARPGPRVMLLGLVAFCVLFGEGAVADWSAVYLRDVTGAGPGLMAAGFAAFSLMMATGRLLGDALTVRFGPVSIVRVGGALATAGMVLVVGQSDPWVAVIGFGVIGAGLSAVFPTVIAAAGRVPGIAASSGIAVVSSIGYTGFLSGPPLIGFLAEATSMGVGFAVVGVATFLIATFATILSAAPVYRASTAPGRALAGRQPSEA